MWGGGVGEGCRVQMSEPEGFYLRPAGIKSRGGGLLGEGGWREDMGLSDRRLSCLWPAQDAGAL